MVFHPIPDNSSLWLRLAATAQMLFNPPLLIPACYPDGTPRVSRSNPAHSEIAEIDAHYDGSLGYSVPGAFSSLPSPV